MKFIPTPMTTTTDISTNMARLERDIHLKVFFAGHDTDTPVDTIPKLYVKSNWKPPPHEIPPWVDARFSKFSRQVSSLFHKRTSRPNLLPFQLKLLRELRSDPNLLFPDADKNLGPCAVTYEQYVQDCLVHLTDTTTFTRLTPTDAHSAATNLEDTILRWVDKHKRKLTPMDRKYILQHVSDNKPSPFGQFYVTYKIHKPMVNGRYTTRPVCSDVTSLPHGLGKWVDQQLQPIARAQPSFFQDSYSLRQSLDTLQLPPNALLFTSDAVAMYTNIKTDPALTTISEYIHAEEGKAFHHYDANALTEALEIVFRNNLIKFGDTYWRQISGTGMGISPAPPWATIFFALHERSVLSQWNANLLFYRRFIDDIFGIWLLDECPSHNEELWTAFKLHMQQWHGLSWEFSPLSRSCTFMDLTITIESNRLTTTVYEKPQNLYLYIPPTSAHPKSILRGLITGSILRYYRLCTNPSDANQQTQRLYSRLIHRGYTPERLLPLFQHAHRHATEYISRTHTNSIHTRQQQRSSSQRRVFLHLPYHPDNPPSHTIQSLWKLHVSEPPDQPKLSNMTNYQQAPIEIDQLTIAYHRPPNLRNQLSIRTIHGRGRDVSTFL
jgi:hypothetical protein